MKEPSQRDPVNIRALGVWINARSLRNLRVLRPVYALVLQHAAEVCCIRNNTLLILIILRTFRGVQWRLQIDALSRGYLGVCVKSNYVFYGGQKSVFP
jgi:hypothetical protein